MSDRAGAIAAWYRHVRPEAGRVRVTLGKQLSQGHSNQVLVAEVSSTVAGESRAESWVVRLPPTGPPLFPEYDLLAEAAAQDVADAAGVPVPRPLLVELDDTWLGVPFLAMPLVNGRHPGEVPVLTDWLRDAPAEEQARVQHGMLDALATLHRAPWEGTAAAGALRRPGAPVEEVRWWEGYVVWACEHRTAGALLDLLGWCRDRAPDEQPPASVLWGDVRLGNTVVDGSGSPAALLDWEMAAIGPAESDVAWYTALSDMTEHFVGTSLPGFLDRDGVVAHVETALGRTLVDLAWHEAFAVTRAAAAAVRTRVVAALLADQPLPDPDTDPVVRYAVDRVLA